MFEMPQKIRWAVIRYFIFFLALTLPLTLGLSGYVLGPLITYFYFKDWRFWNYHRIFFPATFHSYYVMYKWVTDKDYRSMFQLPFTARPMSGPDLQVVRIADSWKAGAKDCNMCARCCTEIRCPMLDRATNRCRSYDSLFWQYFNCGRYPLNEKQIRYYGCPKWEMIPGAKS